MTVRFDLGRKCLHCGQPAFLVVSDEDAAKITEWAERGSSGHIQDELPFLTPAQRELLISGTHSECWEEMFAEEDE
jgi:hypothetical protein